MDAELLRQRLGQRPLLLDGGLGSLFIARGLEPGEAPEHWVLKHPDRVIAAHRSYVEAGSDLIHAVTFGGSAPKLHSAGLSGQCREVNAAAIELAREACAAETLLAADIGPSGLMFPPMGTATARQLTEVFTEQIEAVAAAGADLVHIETMYDLREAEAAVAAAIAVGVPAFASMTFDRRRRGFFTIVGNRIGPSLNALADRGAIAVGMNCSVESEPMVAMVREAVAEVPIPILAQPNAGKPRVTATGVVYDATPEKFVTDLMAMVEAGVQAVGGCCGTTAEFIVAARAALDARERA